MRGEKKVTTTLRVKITAMMMTTILLMLKLALIPSLGSRTGGDNSATAESVFAGKLPGRRPLTRGPPPHCGGPRWALSTARLFVAAQLIPATSDSQMGKCSVCDRCCVTVSHGDSRFTNGSQVPP